MKNALILLLLAATWVAVITIFLTPEASNVGGFPHPNLASPTADGKPQLFQGGDGFERHQPILLASWILSALMVVGMVALLAWSLAIGRRAGNDRAKKPGSVFFWPLVIVGFVLYEGVFAMTFSTYRESLADPAQPEWLGPFPAAETWYFATWLAPVYFAVIYVVFFHQWVAPPESRKRFDALLTRCSKQPGQAGTTT